MNTPSHLIITAALEKKFGGKANMAQAAFLLGAVMPDIPLGILSLVATFYYRLIVGYQSPDLMEAVLHPLYFNNPFWISAHSVLHSPLALGFYLAILWRWRDQSGTVRYWLFWFVAGCILHTGIDILTHYDDGPLLLWPLNWQLRFHSPISYWDSSHYGRQFAVFELVLDAALLGYLFVPRIIPYFARRQK
ncbi:MAG: metal-dependent hydrolase [Anaerolineales bacterium]|nr:metal-dependent hydrolase [Anaerolineales bacterium]